METRLSFAYTVHANSQNALAYVDKMSTWYLSSFIMGPMRPNDDRHEVDLLSRLLEETARNHRHLCPRQVLGVRMGLWAGELLQLSLPQAVNSKRLFTIVETDGCAADGVAVSTNCWVGRRTLRIEDYGKIAATFVDTKLGHAVRLVPRRGIRQQAAEYVPEARNKWEAMLQGYQRMPIDQLLIKQEVTLVRPLEALLSRPRKKAICDSCGEEILNEREKVCGVVVLCMACAGSSYYKTAAADTPPDDLPPIRSYGR